MPSLVQGGPIRERVQADFIIDHEFGSVDFGGQKEFPRLLQITPRAGARDSINAYHVHVEWRRGR